MKNLVSVIIPTFNRAHVLGKCIDSVLNQSYQNLEVIIIDDGSTDNTKSVLSHYKDHIKVIYQNNSGVSSARNAGVANANGKYIAFLDSDDSWHKDKLKIQLEKFENNNIALMACNAELVDITGNRTIIYDDSIPEFSILDFFDIYCHPYLGIPNVVLLKDVFNEMNGFNEELKTAEDIDLFLRVALKYNVGLVNNILTEIHVSNDSISAGMDSYIDNIFVLEELQRKNRFKFNGKEQLVNKVMSKLYNEYARSLLWSRQYSDATNKLFVSLKYKFKLITVILLLKSYIYRWIKP